VALARALAPEPDVVLLDEPFASLDAGLRIALRADVARILREAGATGLLVTHDQQEALSLADVVVVLRDGTVEQVGTPQSVYDRPASRWVAEFLGAATVLAGVATAGAVCCELGRLAVDAGPEGDVEVIVRPEQVRVADVDGADADAVQAEVVAAAYFGHDHLLDLALPDGAVVQSRGAGGAPWTPGQTVAVRVEGPVTVVERRASDR
jgi:iron(III) transport system ATP-binding protein